MEKIEKFEEILNGIRSIWSQGQWDWRHRENLISKYVDPRGGVWTVGGENSIGPCGCKLEVGSNNQREWFYCPGHKENGILVVAFDNNGIYWLPVEKIVKP